MNTKKRSTSSLVSRMSYLLPAVLAFQFLSCPTIALAGGGPVGGTFQGGYPIGGIVPTPPAVHAQMSAPQPQFVVPQPTQSVQHVPVTFCLPNAKPVIAPLQPRDLTPFTLDIRCDEATHQWVHADGTPAGLGPCGCGGAKAMAEPATITQQKPVKTVQRITIGAAEFSYIGTSPFTINTIMPSLKNGQAIVTAHGDVNLTLSNCDVLLKSGTIAMVTDNGTTSEIAVLAHRRMFKPALVVCGGSSVALYSGQIAAIGTTAGDLQRTLKSEGIVGRNARTSPDGRATIAEYSVKALANRSSLLNNFCFSKNAAMKHDVDALLKMCAVLDYVTAGNGPFSLL